MPQNTDHGIRSLRCNKSVDETLNRLKRTLQTKGVTVFALVDHSGEAEEVGLNMRPASSELFF